MAIRGIIVAMTPGRVIGLEGTIPWHYPADLKRFKRLTTGATVIMGRRTWESLPEKNRPLPDRRNVVITSREIEGVETYPSLEEVLGVIDEGEDVWFIGGEQLYDAALDHADFIDVVWVPEEIEDPDATRFPPLDPLVWEEGEIAPLEEDPRLKHQVFWRRG